MYVVYNTEVGKRRVKLTTVLNKRIRQKFGYRFYRKFCVKKYRVEV